MTDHLVVLPALSEAEGSEAKDLLVVLPALSEGEGSEAKDPLVVLVLSEAKDLLVEAKDPLVEGVAVSAMKEQA